jgi:hypothetical protein
MAQNVRNLRDSVSFAPTAPNGPHVSPLPANDNELRPRQGSHILVQNSQFCAHTGIKLPTIRGVDSESLRGKLFEFTSINVAIVLATV